MLDRRHVRDRIAQAAVAVFDFDGTLVDTGPAILRCAARALELNGYDLDALRDLHLMIGPPLVDGFREVAGVSREDALPLVAAYRELFRREVTPEDYPPLPGAVELLGRLRARGVRTAIATSRLEASALEMLAAADLPPFDAVAGRLEPGRSTKADCIAAALDILGCTADASVMVGDRRNDVEGAHALGIPCIGVYRDERGRAELEEAGADALAGGMAMVADLLGGSLPGRAV